MELKTILKLVGAGVTGGYLALKIRRPRNSYDEFLKVYDAVSLDFLRQLENTFLQTMLPAVSPEDRDQLDELFDNQPTFQETLRFFQRHLPDFDDLVLKAMSRFCTLRAEDRFCTESRRKLSRKDAQTYSIAIDQLFVDLEESFLDALNRNLPPERREAFDEAVTEEMPLKERLILYRDRCPNFGSVVFDALSAFSRRVHHVEE